MSDYSKDQELNTTDDSSFFGIITENVLSSKKISRDSKLLYIKITMYARKSGCAWPSNKTLADYFEVSESTIKRWLRELKDNGFIHVSIQKRGMYTDRKIYPNLNATYIPFSNKVCEGASMTPSSAHPCPPNNISKKNNIKNPPPPSSKSQKPKAKPKPQKEPRQEVSRPPSADRSEEEDFFALEEKKKLLEDLSLSDQQILRLAKAWSLEKIRQAVEIFKTHEIKKDPMGLLINILKHPENWEKKKTVQTEEEKAQKFEKTMQENRDFALSYKNKFDWKIYNPNGNFVTLMVKVNEIIQQVQLFYYELNFKDSLKYLITLLNKKEQLT